MVIESVQRWDSAPVADPARSVTITCSVSHRRKMLKTALTVLTCDSQLAPVRVFLSKRFYYKYLRAGFFLYIAGRRYVNNMKLTPVQSLHRQSR